MISLNSQCKDSVKEEITCILGNINDEKAMLAISKEEVRESERHLVKLGQRLQSLMLALKELTR